MESDRAVPDEGDGPGSDRHPAQGGCARRHRRLTHRGDFADHVFAVCRGPDHSGHRAPVALKTEDGHGVNRRFCAGNDCGIRSRLYKMINKIAKIIEIGKQSYIPNGQRI